MGDDSIAVIYNSANTGENPGMTTMYLHVGSEIIVEESYGAYKFYMTAEFASNAFGVVI